MSLHTDFFFGRHPLALIINAVGMIFMVDYSSPLTVPYFHTLELNPALPPIEIRLLIIIIDQFCAVILIQINQ